MRFPLLFLFGLLAVSKGALVVVPASSSLGVGYEGTFDLGGGSGDELVVGPLILPPPLPDSGIHIEPGPTRRNVSFNGNVEVLSGVDLQAGDWVGSGSGTWGILSDPVVLSRSSLARPDGAYIGFRVAGEDGWTYGWMEVVSQLVVETAGPYDIVYLGPIVSQVVYENTENASLRTGVIPEPGTGVLVGIGGLVLLNRRQRWAE